MNSRWTTEEQLLAVQGEYRLEPLRPFLPTASPCVASSPFSCLIDSPYPLHTSYAYTHTHADNLPISTFTQQLQPLCMLKHTPSYTAAAEQ